MINPIIAPKQLSNIDFEKSVLSSLMNIDNSFDHVSSVVTSSDFHLQPHQFIFSVIEQLSEKGKPYTFFSVHDHLTRLKQMELAGGEAYLMNTLASAPASLHDIVFYSSRINNLAKQRRARDVYNNAIVEINDDEVELSEKINNTISKLVDLSNKDSGDFEPVAVSDLMKSFFDNLEDSISGKRKAFKQTGFIDLDRIAPIENGDLVVIAARPSMGKTTLAMNIMEFMTSNEKIIDEDGNDLGAKTAVFFSMEMGNDAIMMRFMASQASVDMSKLRQGRGVNEDDWAAMMKIATQYKNGFPLMIDDRRLATYQQMRSTLNKLRARGHTIGVITVDYLQIMGGLDANNLTNSLGEVTSNLKAIAKEFDCPIIVLSQLNRDLEKRPNKRPVNSDLRGSGAIEQDADVIMFLYRDEVYNENSEDKGIAEVIIGKNRQGEIGTVRLGFEGQHSRFSNFLPHINNNDNHDWN